MRIRLALVESDEGYLNRIVTAFNKKYVDKFEIYSFTKLDAALDGVSKYKIDVLIASDDFEVDTEKLPSRCGFAYFVDSSDVELVREVQAICKYQRADLIYKQILGIYSELAGEMVGKGTGDSSCKAIAFTAPAGGVGTTSAAAACAVRFAKFGKRVLYLNLDKFGATDLVFSAEGQFDMSDIIFAIKSKKTNLPMKLESCVRRDKNGVFFFSQPKVALDMMELEAEDESRMLATVRGSNNYDYIIVDKPFSIGKETIQFFQKMNDIVLVSNGSESANSKTDRALTALLITEQRSDTPVMSRISVFYNDYGSKSGKKIANTDMRELGGAPHYSQATIRQVVYS